MLTTIEKILFIMLVLGSLFLTWSGVQRIIRAIGRGQGKPDWKVAQKRLVNVLLKVAAFQPVFRFRPLPSLMHGLIGWGFIYFLVVNLVDFLRAFWPCFELPDALGNLYSLLADISGLAVLIGMIFMIVRRFATHDPALSTRAKTFLSPAARSGISRDSAIVATFILIHISGRIFGEAATVALTGSTDRWQPFVSTVAGWMQGWSKAGLTFSEHLGFWLSLGGIVVFLPYFPHSKHIHLFFAPLNFLLKPERKSIGQLGYINLDDASIEQFGAANLEHLGWEQVMDSYACIMCFRCQEVCPAYNTGKLLSPAALEINKRYYLNADGGKFAAGAASTPLTEFAIPPEAVWACTSCGACVDICPVGNEPMRDILEIRRNLAMMESDFPKQLETAFKGMERNANPWNISQADRMKWADGLNVPTIEQNPEPEILWWVGCAPATDQRAQKTARAFAKILEAAGVNYAVLGRSEQCTGDSARRAGREDIFFGLASANVEILNEVAPKRIVTTCPHCLHTLKNEYPAFGGSYEVIHHTQFINELVGAGKITLAESGESLSVTFHDPCYLGRHNGITEEPRNVLKSAGALTIEMPRHAEKSFCCGAGGAQMWKEEEAGEARVNLTRYAEAKATGAKTVAVGCPFCLTMMSDAAKTEENGLEVLDVAEIVAARLK